MLSIKTTHFKYKDTYRLKLNEWGKTYHANINKKKVGLTLLISETADFRAGKIIKDIARNHI